MVPKYHVTFSSNLKNQGHPFFTSEVLWGTVSKQANTIKTFLFLWFVGSRKSMACEPDAWLWRVTLHVKVTWPHKWPILSRALYMLETWIFVLFPWFVGSRKSMTCRLRYVALTRDLVRQGHVTLQVTYLISGPLHARDINFCFVSMVCWVKEVNDI